MLSKLFGATALFLVATAGLGCSKARIVRGPDGTAHLDCARGMKDCVNQAAKICGDEGYTILGGNSHTTLVGARDSPYKKATESGQLDIRCGVRKRVEQQQSSVTFRLGPRKDAPSQSAPVPAAPPAASPASACIAGSTQRCLGPGACEGAQSCLSDGSGFGPCDCGKERTGAPSSDSTRETKPPAEETTPPKEASPPNVVGSGEPAPAPPRAQPSPPPTSPMAP